MTGRPVNAELVAALEDYLARRRALGFGLIEEERHARRFLEWLWVGGHIRASFTATQAVTWARGDGSFARSYEGQRLAAVRGLSRYCQATGMDVGVPAANALRAGRSLMLLLLSSGGFEGLLRGEPVAVFVEESGVADVAAFDA